MNILEYAIARKLLGGSGGSSGGDSGGGNSGGGGSVVGVSPKAVNFRDYDGTVLHSYTKDEALALTALPDLPTRAGLICQEWNWSFEDMQSYVADYGVCEVGATYITDDGKTRLHITIAAEGRMNVPLYFQQTVANGVTIDWGDGSATETLSDTGAVNTTHTYASVGDYVIALDVVEGCELTLGHGSDTSPVMHRGDTSGYDVCSSMLRRVEIGKNVTTIASYGFQDCRNLVEITLPNSVRVISSYAFSENKSITSIVIPKTIEVLNDKVFYDADSLVNVMLPSRLVQIKAFCFQQCRGIKKIVIPPLVTSINNYLFTDCHLLADVVIPNGVTSFINYCFQSCYSLTHLTLPPGLKTINSYAFDNCKTLTSIKIPNGVTSFSSYTFRQLTNMVFYDFTDYTSVPSLSSTNVFQGIPSDCQIRVLAALAEEWKAKTNWSNYASQIVGV